MPKIRLYSKTEPMLICIMVLLSAVLLLSGCDSKSKAAPDYQFTGENQSSAVLTLDDHYIDFSVDGDEIYLVGNDRLSVYSGTDGKITELLSEGGLGVAAYNGWTALLREDSITVYDDSRREADSYTLPDKIVQYKHIIMNDKWIVFSGGEADLGYARFKLFSLDRGSGEISELTEITVGKTVYVITGIDFTDQNSIAVTAKITHDFFNDSNILAMYDLTDSRLISEVTLPYSSDISFAAGELYFSNELRVCRYSPDENVTTVIRRYDADSIQSDTLGKLTQLGRKMKVTSENILYLFPSSNLLYIDRLRYDSEPIRIIAPASARLYDHFEDEIAAFTTASKIPVEVIELPDENYGEKLNLKLLAEDDGFDLFLLTDVTDTNTLAGLLKKEMYRPLDDFDEVQKIFDEMYTGIESMMTYDDRIYGIPMEFSYAPLLIRRDIFTKYDLPIPDRAWTFDDVWELCERVKALDSDVRVFNNDCDLFMSAAEIMVEKWQEDISDNTDRIAGILTKLRSYLNEGSLAFENGSIAEYNYNDDKEYLFRTFSNYTVPDYTEKNEDTYPWPVIDKGDAAVADVLRVFMMNHLAPNAERAAELLSYIYKSERFALYYETGDAPYSDIMQSCTVALYSGDMLAAQTSHLLYDAIYDVNVSIDAICEKLVDIFEYRLLG